MSVKKEKKKSKKQKEKDILPAETSVTEVPDGEEMRRALKETAKIGLFASLFPLKLELSEENCDITVTSFLLSARLKNDSTGFSFEITKGAMKSPDFVCLMKTLYRYYKKLCP